MPERFFRYLPAYPEIDGWGARVLDAGCTTIPAGQAYPAPGHPEDHHFDWETGRRLRAWTFVYITAGGGSYESDVSGVEEVRGGDVFVIFPGVWHRYRPNPDTGWNEYWVECEGELLQSRLERTGFEPSRPVLSVGHSPALLRCFTDVLETLRDELPGYQAVIGMQTMTLLARLSSLVQASGSPGDRGEDELVRRALIAMHERLGETIEWEPFSAALGVSYSTLRRLIPKVTGRAPGRLFMEMKISRAKQLLGNTRLSIQEIALSLGFESASHFSHAFRARTGKAPKHFRDAGAA